MTIRDWTDTQGATVVTANATANITDATCYVCDSAGASSCDTTAAVTGTNGVMSYLSANNATFSFK